MFLSLSHTEDKHLFFADLCFFHKINIKNSISDTMDIILTTFIESDFTRLI